MLNLKFSKERNNTVKSADKVNCSLNGSVKSSFCKLITVCRRKQVVKHEAIYVKVTSVKLRV